MQEVDDEARIGEALTKTIICALKSKPSVDNKDNWLNPTEVQYTLENFNYLDCLIFLKIFCSICSSPCRGHSTFYWCWPCRQSVHMTEGEEFAYCLGPKFRQKQMDSSVTAMCTD